MRDEGEVAWWRTTTVCDLPPIVDGKELHHLASLLPALAENGLQTLLVHLTILQLTDGHLELTAFIGKAHHLDLKVIVRVVILDEDTPSPATAFTPILKSERGIHELSRALHAALEAGADGIDLGSIDGREEGEETDRVTTAIREALATVTLANENAVLTADAAHLPHEQYVRYLTDEWFHHLRSDGLITAPWNTAALHTAITRLCADHDSLGHALPWYYADPCHKEPTWAAEGSAERWGAMTLFVASLPGAIYLPFLHVGGQEHSHPEGKVDAVSFAESPAQERIARLVKVALSVREDENLGNGPLAFVTGLPWAGEVASVHLVGTVMVALNTGDDDIVVPREHCLLAATDNAMLTPGGGTTLPPNSCAWFRAAEPTPLDPGNYPPPSHA